VKRSIEFPVDPAWVRNPTNSPLATMGQRQAAAARTKLCIVTIGLVLTEHFRTPPGAYYQSATNLQANRWTVTLTRISMGTLDPITGGASMKAVQDAVAQWCGVPNERDPVWSWVEPIRQENRARGYFGVRIEIEDLAPGEALPVTLKTIAPFIWKAKQRIKEAKSMQIKKVGRVSSYQPEAAARGASSAARGTAEQTFAKLTGKPTVNDLARAGARVLLDRMTPERAVKIVTTHIEAVKRGDPEAIALDRDARAVMARRVPRDPGEERAARDLAPCTTCSVHVGEACDIGPGERVIYGVHVARAIAAKLPVLDDDRASLRPARAPTNGVRKAAAQRPMPVYVRLPWEQRVCGTCDGAGAALDKETGEVACCWTCDGALTVGMRLRPADIDGPTVVYRVPPEHVDRFGPTVTLTRRPHESARTGVCWLYE
jgi:hypothetical protein